MRLQQALTPKPQVYNPKRTKPKLMRQNEMPDKCWGKNYPLDNLMVMCCVATWIPASRRALTLMEEVQGEVLEARRAQESLTTSTSGREIESPLRLIASKVQLFQVDISEGKLVQNKFGFRCAQG